MRKTVFDQKPDLLTSEGRTVAVNFLVEEVTVTNDTAATTDGSSSDSGEAKERTVWEGYTVRVSQPIGRDKVIDAIISAAYPQDVMQAIVNNHLLDTEGDEGYEEHLAEWNAMQDWRKVAKEVANEAMEAYFSK